METNKYHVPKKQWSKWSPGARAVFNNMYMNMRRNQLGFVHPEAEVQPLKQWETTAWNAAWIAASAACSEGA